MKVVSRMILLSLTLAGLLTGCSKDDDSSSTATYQGAGSRWAASFTGGNFVITHFADVTDTVPDMTVNGTYTDYSSGFRHLTVSSSSGSGGPSAGDEAYGFEVPGFAFFLKPVGGSDEEPIVMINAGACPTTDFNANWIIASYDPGSTLDVNKDVFGYASFVFSGASSAATINQLNALTAAPLAGSPQVASFDSTSCSNGVLTFSPSVGETVDMFFTTNGGALVHSFDGATHDSIIFAAPKASAAVTQATLAGTYSALVFDDNGSVGDKLFPGKLVIPSAGAASFDQITDVATDAVSGSPVAVTAFASVAASPGLFSATVDADGRISCTYIPFGGSKVIACTGYSALANNNKPFFLLGKAR